MIDSALGGVMAHIRNTGDSKHGRPGGYRRSGTTMRRTLRREAPSTIGLLADEQDFAAMRRYRTFTFDDHTVYLQQVEVLLKSLSAQGMHATVALFDPEEYAEYCAESGLAPDTPASRSRFTAEIASAGATVAYTGQPIDTLIPLLVSRAVRRATWEYATMILGRPRRMCGLRQGRRPGRLRPGLAPAAPHAGDGLPGHPPPGLQHPHRQREPARRPAHRTGQRRAATRLETQEGAEFVTVLAVGIALERPGGVVLRTSRPGTQDRVHGWRLTRGALAPLSAGEVFSAYCTDADTGEPVAPESHVEYCAGFDLGADTPESHH